MHDEEDTRGYEVHYYYSIEDLKISAVGYLADTMYILLTKQSTPPTYTNLTPQ